MIYPGGEVAFVTRLITESFTLGTRVQWYSTMLGKLSSVKEVVELLVGKGVRNWAVRAFVQGGKTRRWGVAWSFCGRRPPVGVAREGGMGVEKGLLVFPSEFDFGVEGKGGSGKIVGEKVDGLMGSLDVRWRWKGQMLIGVGFAEGNVWSRAARRKRLKEEGKMDVDKSSAEEMEDSEDEREPALGFKISVKESEEADGGVSVHIRWLVGMDSVLFESFCGMVKRELTKQGS